MLRQVHIMTSMVNPILKILNSKLVIMSEYQNIKAFLQKTTNEIGWKIFFFIEKVKNTVPRGCY